MNRKEYDRLWRAKNRTAVRATQKRYHDRHRERINYERREAYARDPSRRNTLDKAWREANPERLRSARRIWEKRNRLKMLLAFARCRAKRLGLRFSVKESDLEIPKRCPVFGFLLSKVITKGNLRSPSIDRIIPRKGYVKGNVAVISLRANLLKNNATPGELKALARWTARVAA